MPLLWHDLMDKMNPLSLSPVFPFERMSWGRMITIKVDGAPYERKGKERKKRGFKNAS